MTLLRNNHPHSHPHTLSGDVLSNSSVYNFLWFSLVIFYSDIWPASKFLSHNPKLGTVTRYFSKYFESQNKCNFWVWLVIRVAAWDHTFDGTISVTMLSLPTINCGSISLNQRRHNRAANESHSNQIFKKSQVVNPALHKADIFYVG